MVRSPRSAALAVALLLCAAGARAAAAAGEGGAAPLTTKEAKAIVAVFAERPKLLRVMRLVIDAIEKEKKKRRKGRRGLLEVGDGAGDVEAACLSYVDAEGNEYHECDRIDVLYNPQKGPVYAPVD